MTSTIKVNNIQNQCGQNIINENSNTITLGASGDTIALASGASQSGFGRTGTVDWQTTPKTGDFTAVNGEGYFINTTSGAITMTMPAGSAGAIVSIQDYNKTFDTNALTITPASGERINGGTVDGALGVVTEGQGLTFVYVDATVGWKSVHENEFTSGGASFIVATGGTETISGDCKIHTFTGPGTFAVSSAAVCAARNVVSYMIVGGGGGGASGQGGSGGGGGAGGYREVKSPLTPFTASPLDGYPSAPNRVTVSIQNYPIVVGAGGAGTGVPDPSPYQGNVGNDSSFGGITGAGGGYGGCATGGNGGSGGGGNNASPGGTGNTPPTSPAQGQNGGAGTPGASSGDAGGGGGGAGGTGTAGTNPPNGGPGGPGGNGVTSEITTAPVTRAGGGGGGVRAGDGAPTSRSAGSGGSGGGGGGGRGGPGPTAGAGTTNTGGGGGGGGYYPASAANVAGAAGGSGVVVIRYKFQ
jgi:hypothetical protein